MVKYTNIPVANINVNRLGSKKGRFFMLIENRPAHPKIKHINPTGYRIEINSRYGLPHTEIKDREGIGG